MDYGEAEEPSLYWPKDKHGETLCYIRDPDGCIIEVAQNKLGFAYG
jgi:hypothetical protein